MAHKGQKYVGQPKKGEGSFSSALDKMSENILYLLSLNSRRNVTEMGRQLALSGMQIHYRIRKLRAKDAIRFATIVNAPISVRFTMLLSVKALPPDFLDKLKACKEVCVLRETTGEYDLHIVCDVESEEEKKKSIAKLKKAFGRHIQNIDVLDHSWMLSLGYKSFCHRQKLLTKVRRPKLRPLTEDERTLLEGLRKNPTDSYRNLFAKTGIHYNYMQNIVDRLTKDGLMQSTLFMDYPKLNLQYHHLALKLKGRGGKRLEEYLWEHPRVHFLKKTEGRWDYIVSVVAKDMDEFIDVARKIRDDNVRAIEDSSVMISKLTHSWKDNFPPYSV